MNMIVYCFTKVVLTTLKQRKEESRLEKEKTSSKAFKKTISKKRKAESFRGQ